MRKFLIGAALVLALATPAKAQMGTGLPVTPLGYCQLSAATLVAATLLSSCSGGIPTGANMILLGAEAQSVRWRDDGVAPTTAIGMVIISTQQPFLYSGTLSKLQFINATAGSILNVSFYKSP